MKSGTRKDHRREHVAQQHGEEQEVPAGETEARKRIGRRDSHDHRKDCRDGRHEKAVPEEAEEVLADAVLRIKQFLVAC
jgi:hypothetical protein